MNYTYYSKEFTSIELLTSFLNEEKILKENIVKCFFEHEKIILLYTKSNALYNAFDKIIDNNGISWIYFVDYGFIPASADDMDKAIDLYQGVLAPNGEIHYCEKKN